MKKDRKDSDWYKNRLNEAKKPRPMTASERRTLFYTNNALLRQAPTIVADAIKRGWISPPEQPQKKFHIGLLKKWRSYDQED